MTAGMGHNNPPPYDQATLDELANDCAAFIDASNAWLKTEVDSDEKAEKLSDQIDGLRKLYKRTNAARADAKKPHDDAGEEVQAAFKPILDRLTIATGKLKPKLAAFALAKQKAEEARKAAAAEEARKAKAEADRLAAEAAASDDIESVIEANEAAERAADLEKAANTKADTGIRSASGAGRTMSLRKRKACAIANINLAFRTMRDEPKVAELLIQLANARANAADFDGELDGFTITETASIA